MFKDWVMTPDKDVLAAAQRVTKQNRKGSGKTDSNLAELSQGTCQDSFDPFLNLIFFKGCLARQRDMD